MHPLRLVRREKWHRTITSIASTEGKPRKVSVSLDESFDYFYHHKGFGPQIDSTPVPEPILEAYRGKLPDALLTYWRAMGWGGYGNGLLWLVDPRDYAEVLNAWIHATNFYGKDRYHVFARGAFGDLYVWGERTGPSLHINSPYSMIFPSDDSADMARGEADLLLQTWLIVCEKDAFDMEDDNKKPLFERAVKLLGRPGPDEMFAFVPALVLGGPSRLDHLQKVNAVEHLMFLAQVQPPRVMLDIVKEAKSRELM